MKILPRLRDLTGKSREGSSDVENESRTHPADRNAAVTDSDGRGLPHSASSVNAVMNATESVKSELTRPLCELIAIVHLDRNCLSSSESDSMHTV